MTKSKDRAAGTAARRRPGSGEPSAATSGEPAGIAEVTSAEQGSAGREHSASGSNRARPPHGLRYEALLAPDDSWHVFDSAAGLPVDAADGALIGLDRWTALAVVRHLNTGKPGLATFRTRGGRLIVISN